MARIRSKDTKPEMRVRRLAHGMGYRYRLHARDLPGQPDLVFRPRRKAIFVHGCFWHRHEGCPRNRSPKSPERREYWRTKLNGNVQRDRRNIDALESMGWATLVVWECETTDADRLSERLRSFLAGDVEWNHSCDLPDPRPPNSVSCESVTMNENELRPLARTMSGKVTDVTRRRYATSDEKKP